MVDNPQRTGQAGSLIDATPVLPAKVVTVAVPGMPNGTTSTVVLAADSDFADYDGVFATPTEALTGTVAPIGAWLSNVVTGEVTLKFAAIGGDFVGGDIDFLIQAGQANA